MSAKTPRASASAEMRHPADVGRLVGMTVALSWLDGEQAVEELAAVGFTAVEVHVEQIRPALPGVQAGEAHAAAVGQLLLERGLVPSSLNAAGVAGFEPLSGDRDGSVEALAHHLRLAAALGAPRLICWDGRLGGSDAGQAPASLAAVIDDARRRSQLDDPPIVSVELHPFTFALASGLVAETAAALHEVGAGLCVDFCHFGVALGPAFATTLEREVIAATNHVHLSDGDCVTSELHFPLGQGVIDVEASAALFWSRPISVAWDLFGWPAPRRAMREGFARYARIVEAHQRSLATVA